MSNQEGPVIITEASRPENIMEETKYQMYAVHEDDVEAKTLLGRDVLQLLTEE